MIDLVDLDLERGFRNHVLENDLATRKRWQQDGTLLPLDEAADLTFARLDDYAKFAQTNGLNFDDELADTDRIARRAFKERITHDVIRGGYNGSDSTFLVSPRTKPVYDFWNHDAVFDELQYASLGYAADVNDILPVAGRFGETAASKLIESLPPMVIDHYLGDVSGSVVVTPALPSALGHEKRGERFSRSRSIIKDGVSFSKDIGSQLVGLSAIMPSLTKMGKAVQVEGVVTTTGHAGTLTISSETVRLALEAEQIGDSPGRRSINLGFIGALGKICSVTTDITLRDHINSLGAGKVMLADRPINQKQLEKRTQELRGSGIFVMDSTIRGVLEGCDIVFIATDSMIDTTDVEYILGDLYDDSEPAAVNTVDVLRLGGSVARILGVLPRGVSRSSIDYGGKVHGLRNDYGCALEVLALVMADRLDWALSEVATVEHADRVADLFSDLGIHVAPFQNQGELIEA